MHCRAAKMEVGRPEKLVIEEDQRRFEVGITGNRDELVDLKYNLGDGLNVRDQGKSRFMDDA